MTKTQNDATACDPRCECTCDSCVIFGAACVNERQRRDHRLICEECFGDNPDAYAFGFDDLRSSVCAECNAEHVDAEHVARLRAAASWLLNLAEDDSDILRQAVRDVSADGSAAAAIEINIASALEAQNDSWQEQL